MRVLLIAALVFAVVSLVVCEEHNIEKRGIYYGGYSGYAGHRGGYRSGYGYGGYGSGYRSYSIGYGSCGYHG